MNSQRFLDAKLSLLGKWFRFCKMLSLGLSAVLTSEAINANVVTNSQLVLDD